MHLLGRRNFLKGLGIGCGAHLLYPIARQLLPQALGQMSGAPRLIVWNMLNSIQRLYVPKADAGGALSLHTSFAALEPYKAELSLAYPFFNRHRAHLHGNDAALSVSDRADGDISIDRLIAKTLSAKDPIKSLNLSPLWHKKHIGSSFDGPGQIFPVEPNAVAAYTATFGGAMVDSGQLDKQLALNASLLDFLSADIKRMNGRLAGTEKAKLDQILTSVRGMEQRLSTQTKKDCSRHTPPPASLKTTPIHAVPESFVAHEDIAINALACGLTHVANFAIAENYFDTALYPFLGEDGKVGHHSNWHTKDGEMPAHHVKYYDFHAKQIARLRSELDKFQEGDGTVGRSTLFFIYNESGVQHHNPHEDLFVFLLGNPANALRSAGRVVTLAKNAHCISDGFVTVANAVGVPLNTFGMANTCKGPVREMLR